jgi:tellurite resistance protein TerA
VANSINLTKDRPAVNLRKGSQISVVMSWPPQTDYDLGAEVLYKDGHTESIAMFGAGPSCPVQPTTRDGAVKQNGDAGRSDAEMAEETLTIELNDDILAIVPWAYSAQSNGTGSFYRYKVSMSVSDGTTTAQVAAEDAQNDDRVYTCTVGMITNLPTEDVRVVRSELYSFRNSENRPRVYVIGDNRICVDMNGGPKNDYK